MTKRSINSFAKKELCITVHYSSHCSMFPYQSPLENSIHFPPKKHIYSSPCTNRIWRSRMRLHFESRNSCSSQLEGWSAATWQMCCYSLALRRQLSQPPDLAWCCSAAPQTAAWTGWPEAVASVASHWTSGETRVWRIRGPFLVQWLPVCECVCINTDVH